MNQQNIKLSALITTHIPETDLFTILQSLLRIASPSIEIIIIDDASSGQIKSRLQEVIRSHDNDLVFLFEHDAASGRGNSLNESLAQATGKFIWAPERANRFNENLLQQALNRFTSDPAAIWVMDYDLPASAALWLDDAENGKLPDDSCFIWNRNVLRGDEFFFNPFLTHLHGAELAMRVHDSHVWHRTDPFFVIDSNQFLSPAGSNFEEFFRTAHRKTASPEEKKQILNRLLATDVSPSTDEDHANLLTQSRQYLAQENAKHALELINAFLKDKPEHREALQVKITALEKLRRHVEAAELKHDLRHITKSQKSEPATPAYEAPEIRETPAESYDEKKAIRYSVVVPTTGLGKFDLERSLESLRNAAPAGETELIVIDNASIDDTFDYLQQLTEQNFLNIRVVSNSSNPGFAASVNKGLTQAKGDFQLVMHHDVELEPGTLEKLAAGFELGDDIALTAPQLNVTEHAAQQTKNEDASEFLLTDLVDSCCFMLTKNVPVRFDEEFGLAYYEMEDFCKQLTSNEYQIAVATGVQATHHKGATTQKMGLKLTPQRKWKNRALFHQKWSHPIEYTLPEQGSIADRLERLEPPSDPANPPEEWVKTVNDFLTDEIRTQIVRSELSNRELFTIVSTLLMADCRDLLRTLEDRLNDLELPAPILMLFVNYYYSKNIYSRCRHYLKKAGNSHPAFDLFRLKIYVADQETDNASTLLAKLMETYPASPDLFSLAAKLYQQNGDQDEAGSFAAMANQLDPATYPPEETAFEVKF
jgi:glycosyltransferase involved in cell wall biosynthesis